MMLEAMMAREEEDSKAQGVGGGGRRNLRQNVLFIERL